MSNVPTAYTDHLSAIVPGGDVQRLREVWEPDGVLEFPFAVSLGVEPRYEGVDAIIERFDGAGSGLFGPFEFTRMEAWPIAGADEYVLEMHGSSSLLATGAAYEQDYVVRFGLSPAGRIAWMREFWDPMRMSG